MAWRQREYANFKGVTLRLNFKLKGYVSRQYLWTVKHGNDCSVGLHVYYNVAAGIFHTRNSCSRLYSTEVEFYFKKQKSLFDPPFWDSWVTYELRL